ncbi:MAG TPA: M81 family metallopeptidase, partial [Stellaceae bacterium]|nr:M81 family metallopeptidase [Stellaceae bacterium]
RDGSSDGDEMARIAVGGFQHETNTFAPLRATWEDFARADAWPGYVRGPELFDAVAGFNLPIAGAVETLTGLGHELVPLSWCSAPPSSYVEEDAYERVAAGIIEDLATAMSDNEGPLDGIYLDLHGAMVAVHHQDGEGELLRRIRALAGDRLPIVASLDFHTNMTQAMVRHASAMVGYRTYPHVDMAATGRRAAALLDQLIREKRPLYKAFRQADFLIPLVWQCTLAEPTRGVFGLLDEIERGSASHNQGIVSITHTPGFPPADIAECGPALVVYGHDQEAADAAADRLLAALAAKEAAFAGRLYTPDEAVAEALRLAQTATKPVVLADIQDNPGAGGTSDTVGLLRALIAHRAQGAVLGMIVDPEAAAAAHAAGEGGLLPCGIGAKIGYAGEAPLTARWRVARLGTGDFTGTGPMFGGAKFHVGPTALVTDDDSGVSVVLACARIQAIDQAQFRDVGVEPAAVPILALKSTVHFRADFQPIAETVLCVLSPGAHVSDPVELPYAHLRSGIRMRPLGPPRAS